jgi:hypothetical protein
MIRTLLVSGLGAVLVLGGCVSTTTSLAPAQMSAGPGAAAAILVPTADGKNVSVTLDSELRFQRRDGSFTPWFKAGEIFVNDDGVLVAHAVPLALARTARVEGLAPREAVLLAQTAPPGAIPKEIAPGVLELGISGEAIAGWLDRFIVATARRAMPPDREVMEVVLCRQIAFEGVDCSDAPAAMNCRAIGYLRLQLAGAPLGRWSFAVLARDAGPLAGEAIFAALAEGPRVADGLRWSDIKSVEVKNASPSKTAASIIVQVTVGVALGIALAPVLAVAPAFNGGHESGGGGGAVSSAVGAVGSGGGGGDEALQPIGPTLTALGLVLPGLERMRPLLRGGQAR